MVIDTSFVVTSDSGGRDPDSWSPTLCRYHQLLWSKPSPSGIPFSLTPTSRPPYYHHHSSPLGQFTLSSDAFVPTYTRYGVPRHIIQGLPSADHDFFITITYTIGGLILWPSNPIDRRWTINQARGCMRRSIGDRMDLTLECIRRHYRGEDSPLSEVLERYADFFAVFVNFRGYVDFWLLQDMVAADYSSVSFFSRFDDFHSPAIPQSLETYLDYRRQSISFVTARNERIRREGKGLQPNKEVLSRG